MVGVGHAGDGVHHGADGRPVLAAGGDIGIGALAEHVAGDIIPGLVQPLGGIEQEPLHGLRLALAVGVPVVDGAGLFVLVRAVGEADIVELDLVEPQRGGLQRQLRLVLPDGAVIGAGPVHGADLQRRAVQVGDDVLRVVGGQMRVIEHGDAADDVVARVAELLHVGPEALHGVLRRGVGRGAVLLHHRRGIGHRRAVHNVHHKGVDAAALRQTEVAVGVLDGAAVEIQRPHLLRHVIAGDGGLFRGVVVQPRRVAAAPRVAPGGVALIQRLVVLSAGFLLRHADVGGVDIALAPVTGDFPAEHLALLVQSVKAGDGQRHALFHGAAGDGARLVHKAHAPQGVDRFHLHHGGIVVGQVGAVDAGVALAVDHPDALGVALGILQNILYLAAAGQGTQQLSVFVIYRSGALRGGHIARRRLRHGGMELLPDHIAQRAQRRQAQHDDDHRRAGAAFLLGIR